MNRSTLRSFSVILASAVFSLSLSPLAAAAQAAPGIGPTAQPAETVDIIYGDGDEGAIYVGPVTATPRPSQVALAAGDVVFGDADQGAIDAGPAPAVAGAPHADVASAHAGQDLVFSDDDMGGAPVDLSAFAGRSNISAGELAGGRPDTAQQTSYTAQDFPNQ